MRIIYTSIFSLAMEGLLGIELDDKLLVELEVDIVSCGKCYDLSGEVSCVLLDPLGRYLGCACLCESLDLYAFLAGFLNGDNVTCVYKDRRS